MIDHNELLFWKKCPTCRYSEQVNIEDLSEKMQEIFKLNPLAPRNLVMAVKESSYKKDDN